MGNGVHIMPINETKLWKTTPDCLVSIKDFALERKNRNVYGGGVALYVWNTISYKVIDTLPQHSLELLCIDEYAMMSHRQGNAKLEYNGVFRVQLYMITGGRSMK